MASFIIGGGIFALPVSPAGFSVHALWRGNASADAMHPVPPELQLQTLISLDSIPHRLRQKIRI